VLGESEGLPAPQPGKSAELSKEDMAEGLHRVALRQVRRYVAILAKMCQTVTPAPQTPTAHGHNWDPQMGARG
jgi:hypothetical protein